MKKHYPSRFSCSGVEAVPSQVASPLSSAGLWRTPFFRSVLPAVRKMGDDLDTGARRGGEEEMTNCVLKRRAR